MDVYVHRCERQLEKHRAGGIFAGDDSVAIGFLQRGLHQAAFDITPIDKEMLHRSVGPSCVRLHNIAVYGHAVAFGFRHFDHIGGHLLAEYRKYRRKKLTFPVRGKYLFSVPNQCKSDFRMGERGMLHHAKDIACLGEILFEEFHTRGRVVKQVAHNDCCAFRTAHFLVCLYFPCFQMQMEAGERAPLAGEQVDARDR